MTTTRFENRTGKGNVKAFRIEVSECQHSNAGKAHAKLVSELTSGNETTRDGRYFPTLADAKAKANEWCVMCEATGLVKVN